MARDKRRNRQRELFVSDLRCLWWKSGSSGRKAPEVTAGKNMNRKSRIYLTSFLVLVLLAGTYYIWSVSDELNGILFLATILVVSMWIIAILVQIQKGVPICLTVPLFIGLALMALIYATGISLLVLLSGVIIGIIVGFSGTVIRWARKSDNREKMLNTARAAET